MFVAYRNQIVALRERYSNVYNRELVSICDDPVINVCVVFIGQTVHGTEVRER